MESKFVQKVKRRNEERNKRKQAKAIAKANRQKGKFGTFWDAHIRDTIWICVIWALFLELLLETLGRQATPGVGGFLFLFQHPVVFFYNALIIFATLSVSRLFKRRAFVMSIGIALWGAIGVTNGIILTQRMTPFTVKDLSTWVDGLSIMTSYFSIVEMVLIFGTGVFGVLFFVILFIKGPKAQKNTGKGSFKKSLLVVILIIAATFGATGGLIKANVLNTFFGNLAYAYRDYGVPYCFINTWMNTGIKKPMDYSQEKVEKIIKKAGISKTGTVKITRNDSANQQKEPNILFLQLESFVDPTLFKNVSYSQDPIPYYRTLMKNYSSGSLTVPACGAGTANTEFEAMTGISVKFFGPGEYPFKSVLSERTAESVASDLKDIGYSTHAIHDHRAMFYNRNIVFDNIGFDTFTSVEYMSGVTYTPRNWAKDEVLTGQIMDALKSSKGRDYIYTISVQGHGKYPTEPMIKNPKIKVTKAPNEEDKNAFEYYVNQVYEMDQFVKQLTDTLSKFDEPVVLVMYGDHIPALDITEESYGAKDLYQTQYVIWSNYDLPKKDKDQTAYQLTADVMDRIGMHTGTIFKYHQNTDHSSSSYLPNLKMLGYDMLYGQDYIYGGTNPFHKAGMKMGVKTIKIDSVVNVGGKFYIKGQNFTEQSKVTLDGKTLKTTYLSPSLLGLNQKVDQSDVPKMKVSQIDKSNDTIISTTE